MNEIGALSQSSIKNKRQFYGESSPCANCQLISDDLDVNGEGLMIEIRQPMAGDID